MAKKLFDFKDNNLNKQFIEFERNITYGGEAGKDGNHDAEIVSATSPVAANMEYEVNHNLGRIPKAFMAFNTDKSGSFYKGSKSWTAKKIYIKCDNNYVNALIKIW